MTTASSMPWRRILVAHDLSPASSAALIAAVRLARLASAELVVLNVLELWLPEHPWRAPPTPEEIAVHKRFLAREEDATRRALEAEVARASRGEGTGREALAVRTEVRDGRAADVIVSTASDAGADLIVVGTRRRPVALGSVAERVVRTAHQPVLVVPADTA